MIVFFSILNVTKTSALLSRFKGTGSLFFLIMIGTRNCSDRFAKRSGQNFAVFPRLDSGKERFPIQRQQQVFRSSHAVGRAHLLLGISTHSSIATKRKKRNRITTDARWCQNRPNFWRGLNVRGRSSGFHAKLRSWHAVDFLSFTCSLMVSRGCAMESFSRSWIGAIGARA